MANVDNGLVSPDKPGEQPGVFADVYKAVQTDKRNRKYNYLILVGELEATKSSGRRFVP